MKTIKRILPFAIVLLMVLSLVGCNQTNSQNADSAQTADIFETFPDFEGKDFDGNDVDQTLFAENDVTVLNFWFNGCSACVNEMPGLEKFNEKLREKGAEIVGVNVQIAQDEEALEEAKEILSKQGVTYKNIYITGGDDAEKYVGNIFSFPTTILVDKSGKIIGNQIVGAIDGEKRMQAILDVIDDIKAGKENARTINTTNSSEQEIAKLMEQENDFFNKHPDPWNKVFAQVQKDNVQDGAADYATFLRTQIENIKDSLTAEELKILNDDVKQIEEIEKKIAALKK
ncbi:MAG: TlpA family protein disulfide reductase [Clostridiales bacterium]|nr:TlpA family protein disulfide reductase [Clostridiales bacterium]